MNAYSVFCHYRIENQEKIRLYLRGRETAKTRDIADLLGLSMARTREILSVMDDVEALWSVYGAGCWG